MTGTNNKLITQYQNVKIIRMALVLILWGPIPAAYVMVQAEHVVPWLITLLIMVEMFYGLASPWVNRNISLRVGNIASVSLNAIFVAFAAVIWFTTGDVLLVIIGIPVVGGITYLAEGLVASKVLEKYKSEIQLDVFQARQNYWNSGAGLVGMGLGFIFHSTISGMFDHTSVWIYLWLVSNVIYAILEAQLYRIVKELDEMALPSYA